MLQPHSLPHLTQTLTRFPRAGSTALVDACAATLAVDDAFADADVEDEDEGIEEEEEEEAFCAATC